MVRSTLYTAAPVWLQTAVSYYVLLFGDEHTVRVDFTLVVDVTLLSSTMYQVLVTDSHYSRATEQALGRLSVWALNWEMFHVMITIRTGHWSRILVVRKVRAGTYSAAISGISKELPGNQVPLPGIIPYTAVSCRCCTE